ncbi:MAG: hypothetical protein ACRDMZ_00395, partial [Solirubrobacteraceae bacterium]
MRGYALAAGAVVAAALGIVAAPAVVSGAGESGGIAPAPAGFELRDAKVSPRRAYFAGRRVTIAFTAAMPAPLDLRVDIVRAATRRPVVSIALPAAAPGAAQRVAWDGLTGRGDVAPNGR